MPGIADRSTDSEAVVIGVDVGTTSTKAVAFSADGRVVASGRAGYELLEPQPGQAVQDPAAILAAVVGSVRATVDSLGSRTVRGLAFSSAMHGLLGLGATGEPLTPLVIWADTRAAAQVERLRAAAGGLALHRRTGTPLHPMSPLAKLLWFREHEPELHAQVRHWLGIKDYLLLRLCGRLVTDHSTASGTGLLDLSRLEWDVEALQLARLQPRHLPELVATTTVLDRLTAQAARDTGLAADTRVVVGAGDGPLANLGLGAIAPGVAACSIGTSGALRVMVDRPFVDPRGQLFCYALTEDRWATGGAISNGGVVLEWAGDALAPDLGEESHDALLELAATAPAGSAGLLMLPYLLSERAPHWSSTPQGAYVGLSRAHRREHLVRAALEGVCLQLAVVLDAMRAGGLEIRELRATGGFARSPFWRQLLADVLGMDIGFPDEHEGSSFGAALLGMQALDVIDSLDVAADLVTVSETVRPDRAATATYAALRPLFTDLYEALLPAFIELRRVCPTLPAE